MTLPESETVDHLRQTQTSIKLEYPTQLDRTITTLQYNQGLSTKHHTSLRKIKQLIRKFDPNRVHYIQYAVTSTSFNIFDEGIYESNQAQSGVFTDPSFLL